MTLKFSDLNQNRINEDIHLIKNKLDKSIKGKNIFGIFYEKFLKDVNSEEEEKKMADELFFWLKFWIATLLIFSLLIFSFFGSFLAFICSLLSVPFYLIFKFLLISHKISNISFSKEEFEIDNLVGLNFSCSELNSYISSLNFYDRTVCAAILSEYGKDSFSVKKRLFKNLLFNSNKNELIEYKSDIFKFIEKINIKKERHILLKQYEMLLEEEDTNDKIKKLSSKIKLMNFKNIKKNKSIVKNI